MDRGAMYGRGSTLVAAQQEQTRTSLLLAKHEIMKRVLRRGQGVSSRYGDEQRCNVQSAKIMSAGVVSSQSLVPVRKSDGTTDVLLNLQLTFSDTGT